MVDLHKAINGEDIMAKNQSEEYVSKIGTKTFLSLWSFENPLKPNREELCDFLVVFENDIVIFSVKNIEYKKKENEQVDMERWKRKAIDNSTSQIYGAERILGQMTDVIDSEGDTQLQLPDLETRRIHRVAIALGSNREIPYSDGEFGKGFIHIFDEISFDVVLKELDTINDFINFLSDTEIFLTTKKVVMLGGIEDLLGIYLWNDRTYPEGDTFTVMDDYWKEINDKPEMIGKRQLNKVSYLWDHIIESFIKSFFDGTIQGDNDLSDIEKGLRIMAKENRFNRRILMEDFRDMVGKTEKGKMNFRAVFGRREVCYLFMCSPQDMKRDHRRELLAQRCYVLRGKYGKNPVVGLATEPLKSDGRSYDIVVYNDPELGDEYWEKYTEIQSISHYFEEPDISHHHSEEYPDIG